MTATLQLDLFTDEAWRAESMAQGSFARQVSPVVSRKTVTAAELRDLNKQILECVETWKQPMTDRDIRDRVLGIDADMQQVITRVNELLGRGKLLVAGKLQDPLTRKVVRTVVIG